MRKILAVVIALMLALAAIGAMAEAAAAVTDETYDFGDFSMTYPGDCQLQVAEKTEGGIFFTLLSPATSEGQITNNMNCLWNSEFLDVETTDPQEVLDYTVDGFAAEAEAQGLIVSNVTGLKADTVNVGGRQGIAIAYSYDVDYTNLGVDLQTTLICSSFSFSDPSFGTYIFSVTSGNEAGLNALAGALDSITWNN